MPPANVTVPLPSALTLPRLIVPEFRVTPPVKLLLEESVSLPAPLFTRLPAPLRVPENVVETLLFDVNATPLLSELVSTRLPVPPRLLRVTAVIPVPNWSPLLARVPQKCSAREILFREGADWSSQPLDRSGANLVV